MIKKYDPEIIINKYIERGFCALMNRHERIQFMYWCGKNKSPEEFERISRNLFHDVHYNINDNTTTVVPEPRNVRRPARNYNFDSSESESD